MYKKRHPSYQTLGIYQLLNDNIIDLQFLFFFFTAQKANVEGKVLKPSISLRKLLLILNSKLVIVATFIFAVKYEMILQGFKSEFF